MGKRGTTRKCQVCGHEFSPKETGRRTYCSQVCYTQAKNQKAMECRRKATPPRPPQICATCGQEFAPIASNQQNCGPCREKIRAVRRKNKATGPHLQTCTVCGASFRGANVRQKYCGPACAKQAGSPHSTALPKEQALEREYYRGTADNIRRWHREGMSLEEIGKMTCRSNHNLQYALDGRNQISGEEVTP